MAVFDEIVQMKAFVTILQPLLEDYLGKLSNQETNGTWVESDQPSIYLGYPDAACPDYPRVMLTYNGDTNLSPNGWDSGLEEVVDPDDENSTVWANYTKTYIRYILTLTCDSGANDKVLTGERKSSSGILRIVRDALLGESFRELVHTEMQSTITTVTPVTPTYNLVDTSYHNSSVITLTLDFISTNYDYDTGWFDTIEHTGEVAHNHEDDNPLTYTNTVGPVEE